MTGGLTFYFEGRAKLYTVVSLYAKFDIVRDSIITSWYENTDNCKRVLNLFNEQIGSSQYSVKFCEQISEKNSLYYVLQAYEYFPQNTPATYTFLHQYKISWRT